jgi:hypothetical protein
MERQSSFSALMATLVNGQMCKVGIAGIFIILQRCRPKLINPSSNRNVKKDYINERKKLTAHNLV